MDFHVSGPVLFALWESQCLEDNVGALQGSLVGATSFKQPNARGLSQTYSRRMMEVMVFRPQAHQRSFE